jgi:predicted MFS family arabinose efflux permease
VSGAILARVAKPPLVPADFVVLAAGVCAAIHVGKLPPALPILRDSFGMTLVEAGFLLSLVQLAGMSAGIAVGVAADGFGARRSILCGLAILTVASATGGFAQELWQLMALRALEGLGFLVAILPVPPLLRSLVPQDKLALKLGLWGAFMPTGTALALLCGPWVMTLVGWRGWWWSLAALTAAAALWVAATVPELRHHADDDPGQREWTQRLRATLASPGPWLVALTFAMYSSQWLSIIGFLPTIYAQAGLSVAGASALTAMVAAVNAIGNIAAGRLLHRGVAPERVLGIGFATMIVCAIVAFGVPAPLWFRFAAVVTLSGVGGLIPGALFPLAVDLAPGVRTVSTAVGLLQQFSAVGQFAGPPLVALVASATGGWQMTWTVTGSASLAGIGLALLIGREHRRRPTAG